MKVLIAVKRVIDPYVKIRIKPDNSGVETQNIKMSMNPFDEIAVEEAIRLKESGVANEAIAVTIGAQSAQETLRAALALGADRALHIKCDIQNLPSISIAKILREVALKENIDLVLLGKQSIDGDNNQTAQMLSALLGWPQATFASKLSVNSDEAEVVREVDGGLETIAVKLPAVVSTDLRLNEPRYASLPNIMKAKRKPLDVIELSSLNVNLKAHHKVLHVKAPSVRSAGLKLDSVEELVDKLKNHDKVI